MLRYTGYGVTQPFANPLPCRSMTMPTTFFMPPAFRSIHLSSSPLVSELTENHPVLLAVPKNLWPYQPASDWKTRMSRSQSAIEFTRPIAMTEKFRAECFGAPTV